MNEALNEPATTLGPGGRFRLERRLGAGSTGVVYAAWDNEQRTYVAVKTLRDMDAEGIYHLKREFRSLADVSHPNLVRLHELFGDVDKERWFVTMDLVAGIDFISYVRTDPSVGKLKRAFRQLIEGMEAVHRAGKLHRDIKPSNALVTPEGRVVLLDFGLVTDIALTQLFHTLEPRLVGTPAYLSPEQASGLPLAPSTDFYAAGAMLYEALTGKVPFDGPLLEVLRAKQSVAPSPRLLAPHAPGDLVALCERLLQVNPDARPDAAEVLRCLGAPEPAPPSALRDHGTWVGREREMAAIHAAFLQAKQGHTVVMSLHGSSGVGKSALARRALEQIASNNDVMVLAGRCYERELVPYRGLDNVIDALTRQLARLPHGEVQALLPRDTDALARLFPVLRRIPAFDRPTRKVSQDDPLTQRHRAWSAFRDLLGRIADRKTLILCIDDWQWGDEDSARLLLELVSAPDAPALLLLFCHRSMDEQSACLSTFAQGLVATTRGDLQQHQLPLLPLEPADAERLACALLGESESNAANVAHEAGGNAFFLRALVEHVRSLAHEGHPGAGGVTLDQVIEYRVARLSSDARSLLEVLAIAGRPILGEDANFAAGLDRSNRDAAIELRAHHLLRSRGDQFEIDHDRIRQAVVAALDANIQAHHHRRLLETLAGRPDADPEIMGSHFLALGETKQAAESFFVAGTRAQDALAFERAAALFARSIALAEGDLESQQSAHEHLGHTLASLGRGAAAADEYLKAVPNAPPAKALDLQRRAAEQRLRIGDLKQGLATLKIVLASMGETLATSSRSALLSLVVRRMFVRLRGFGYRERKAADIDPAKLVRLDVFWSVSTALGIIDNVRATDFQTRHLRLALALGEPYRIARALASEVGYSAVRGTASAARTAQLVRAAEAAAARVNDPFARGWATLAAAMAKYLEAQHADARRLCEEADATFQGCIGVWWEMGSARLFGAWSLYYLGDWSTLAQRLPIQIAEAEARGDLYAATSLGSSILSIRWLINDDVAGGKNAIASLIERWPRTDFHALDYWHMVAECSFFLYEGQGEAAWQRLLRDKAPLRRSQLLRVQMARVELADLRARCLLVRAKAATKMEDKTMLLKTAARIALELDRETSAWAKALAAALHAGVDAANGTTAVPSYKNAARMFEHADMRAHSASAWLKAAAFAHTHPAQWSAGDTEAAAAADAWLRKQGVKQPLRIANLLTPDAASTTT